LLIHRLVMSARQIDDDGGPCSAAAVAFTLLRYLIKGHYLWGGECSVSLAELPCTIRAGRVAVARAVADLWDLDMVSLDSRRHTVRLSPQAVRQFVRRTDPLS
jgi:hypothetical protein